MIRRCTCKNEYQDKRYGKQMRVMNPTVKYPVNGGYRCTVCETTYPKGGDKS